MVTDSGDLVVLAVQRGGRDVGSARRSSRRATCCCCAAPGRRSTSSSSDPGVLVVDAPALVRRQAVPLGPGAKRAIAVLAGMVVLLATGAVPAAVAGLLAACGDRAARAADHRAGLPERLVDDGRARRRHDLALDGDGRDRRRRGPRRRARRPRRRRRPVRAAARAVPAHRRARPADQQHGHGADRDPDRALRRGRDGRLAPSRS